MLLKPGSFLELPEEMDVVEGQVESCHRDPRVTQTGSSVVMVECVVDRDRMSPGPLSLLSLTTRPHGPGVTPGGGRRDGSMSETSSNQSQRSATKSPYAHTGPPYRPRPTETNARSRRAAVSRDARLFDTHVSESQLLGSRLQPRVGGVHRKWDSQPVTLDDYTVYREDAP